MGKKRSSKTSKQKQARAKQQHHGKFKKNSSLGSMVVGGGSHKSKSNEVMINSRYNGRSLGSSKATTTSKGPRRSWTGPKKRPPKKASVGPLDHTNGTTQTSSKNEEHEECMRQMASMEERVFRKHEAKGKKKTNIALTKARFALPSPPTTNDLVTETAQKLSNWEGMREGSANFLTSRSNLAFDTTPVRSNLAWAQPVAKKPHTSATTNPFAALQEEDDDDSDIDEQSATTSVLKAVKQRIERTGTWGLSIQAPTFTPASFSLEPRTTATPATTPCIPDAEHYQFDNDQEIDPDL